MFIIFNKTNKTILSSGEGNPTESDNKLILNGNPICNDMTVCGWKYIADQRLETDESIGYLRDADYYETVDPLPSAESRLAAIEMYLLEQELGL